MASISSESNGNLTFNPGDTSAAITVEVLQNSIAGYKDRFHVVLSNPVNAVLQDGVFQLIHEAVIEDDESVGHSGSPGGGRRRGQRRHHDPDPRRRTSTDELTVWLQVAKTAPQADNRRDTVVFPAGDATVDHTITTTDDGQRNGSHTVTATLLDPPAIGEPRTYWVGRPSGGSDTVTVRETHLETVSLLTPTLRVAEGEAITLELARSGASPLTVTLEVTETGDYTTGALPETVSFGLTRRNRHGHDSDPERHHRRGHRQTERNTGGRHELPRRLAQFAHLHHLRRRRRQAVGVRHQETRHG